MSDQQPHSLPQGHVLQEFRIDDILGVGGFGITYLAWDFSLQQKVAIKEYLPGTVAVRQGLSVHAMTDADQEVYQWGLDRFIQEARTLVKFNHPNIVRVHRLFQENNTAYMVMEYEEGKPLDALLEEMNPPPSEVDLINMVIPLLDGLEKVHQAGFLHRDIKPANIFIRLRDESPVLLDFGAARYAVGSRSVNLTSIVTSGYAPPEQYEASGYQGPWSDIYALGATLHRAISGGAPPDSVRRVNTSLVRREADPLRLAVDVGRGRFSMAFLAAIDHAMRLVDKERPATIAQWREELLGRNVAPVDSTRWEECSVRPDPPAFAEQKTAILPNREPDVSKPSLPSWLIPVGGVVLAGALGLIWFLQSPGKLAPAVKPTPPAVNTSRVAPEPPPFKAVNLPSPPTPAVATLPSTPSSSGRVASPPQQDDKKDGPGSETKAWETATSTNTLASYQAYLNRYPQGHYAMVAKMRMESLGGAANFPR